VRPACQTRTVEFREIEGGWRNTIHELRAVRVRRDALRLQDLHPADGGSPVEEENGAPSTEPKTPVIGPLLREARPRAVALLVQAQGHDTADDNLTKLLGRMDRLAAAVARLPRSEADLLGVVRRGRQATAPHFVVGPRGSARGGHCRISRATSIQRGMCRRREAGA
jgi:hypothetical protein